MYFFRKASGVNKKSRGDLFLVPKMGHEPAGVQLLQIGDRGGPHCLLLLLLLLQVVLRRRQKKVRFLRPNQIVDSIYFGDSGEAVSESQPQPLRDGGGLYNSQQHPGFELQQASSGFQVQPSAFSAPQQDSGVRYPGFLIE